MRQRSSRPWTAFQHVKMSPWSVARWQPQKTLRPWETIQMSTLHAPKLSNTVLRPCGVPMLTLGFVSLILCWENGILTRDLQRNVFDIAQSTISSFPPPWAAGYLNSADVQTSLGVPLNFTGESLASSLGKNRPAPWNTSLLTKPRIY